MRHARPMASWSNHHSASERMEVSPTRAFAIAMDDDQEPKGGSRFLAKEQPSAHCMARPLAAELDESRARGHSRCPWIGAARSVPNALVLSGRMQQSTGSAANAVLDGLHVVSSSGSA